MIRVESASIPPGQCAATGKSEGPFVDTLIEVDTLPPFGRVYLSFDWVRTAAMNLCDMRPQSEIDRLQEKLDQAETDIAALRRDNDDLFHVKQILDDWKGTDVSRMPTPTELRHTEPELPDETPNDISDAPVLAVVQETDDDKVIKAFYGEVGTLEEYLILDPVPDTVAEIKDWITESGNPVIERIRTEMALYVEKDRDEPRKTILALGGDDA